MRRHEQRCTTPAEVGYVDRLMKPVMPMVDPSIPHRADGDTGSSMPTASVKRTRDRHRTVST